MNKRTITCWRALVLILIPLLLAACGDTGGVPAETAAQPVDTPAESATAQVMPTAPAAATEAPAPSDSTTPSELESRSLGNMLFHGVLEEDITLIDGKFEGEPFVSGGTSRPQVTLLAEPIAYGDLNGDGRTDAAVILASDTGGSGTFVFLAAVESQDGAPVNVATLPLGDREQVKSMVIDNGRLVVTMLSHAESDPACCPTLEATRIFQLLDGEWIDIER